jgi:hypothetical protein
MQENFDFNYSPSRTSLGSLRNNTFGTKFYVLSPLIRGLSQQTLKTKETKTSAINRLRRKTKENEETELLPLIDMTWRSSIIEENAVSRRRF